MKRLTNKTENGYSFIMPHYDTVIGMYESTNAVLTNGANKLGLLEDFLELLKEYTDIHIEYSKLSLPMIVVKCGRHECRWEITNEYDCRIIAEVLKNED